MCADARNTKDADTAAEKPADTKPAATAATISAWEQFIPDNFKLRDTASGDLNGDFIPDMLLLIDRVSSADAPYESFEPRPLRILYGTADDKFTSHVENGKVVLCRTCGDTLSDPYSGMKIEKGSFSIMHKGRYGIFWNRTITFALVDSSWILRKDAIKARRRQNPYALTYTTVRTKKDFGTIRFETFDVYNTDDYLKTIAGGRIFPVGSQNDQPYFLNTQRVKGGIWKVLDYCTGKITPAYLTFIKTVDSKSELGIEWDVFINIRRARVCEAMAFKNAAYISADSVPLARFEDADSVYTRGTDTLSFNIIPGGMDASGYRYCRLVSRRNGREQKLMDSLDNETFLNILCCADINSDGYLDAVLDLIRGGCTEVVYMSKTSADGTISLMETGKICFTD